MLVRLGKCVPRGDLSALLARRGLVLIAVTAGFAALTPSPAAAEASGTVNITVSGEPAVGRPLSITASGTSSQAGELVIYTFIGSSSCPSVKGREEVKLEKFAPPAAVAAGSYSQTYGFTPLYHGNFVLCGYLYDPSSINDAIYAAGAASFNTTGNSQAAPGATTVVPVSTTGPASNGSKPSSPHLTKLTVRVREQPGHTLARPGLTYIVIQTSRSFAVHVALKRRGHKTTGKPIWSSGSQGTVVVPWTCSRPGGVYTFTVTARDSYGKTLVRRGEFNPVSASRCRALKAASRH